MINNVTQEKLKAHEFIEYYKALGLSGFDINMMPYSTDVLTLLQIINSEIIKNLQVFVKTNRKSLQSLLKIQI